MSSNVALYVLPLAVARTREKLDDVLADWAERRQQDSLAVRVSGPVALPGSEYEVWLLETTNRVIVLLLADLALRARAIVALRINFEVGRAIAQVHVRREYHDAKHAHAPAEIEPVAGEALSVFQGPLDLAPGWLVPWLAAHEEQREVRVLRWHHSRTKTTEWPDGYGKPEEQEWRFYEGIYDENLELSGGACC